MIILEQVTKSGGAGDPRPFLSSVDLVIPTNRVIALFGRSQEAKGNFINLLAGMMMPTSGHIIRQASVSFPIGRRLIGFARALSIRVNVAHVARLYGANVSQTIDLVERAVGLGPAFDKPFVELPKGQVRPLAQALGLALPFDMYLFSEEAVVEPGGRRRGRRQQRSAGQHLDLFGLRKRAAGMIIPTTNVDFALENCNMGLVLHRGRLAFIDSLDRQDVKRLLSKAE